MTIKIENPESINFPYAVMDYQIYFRNTSDVIHSELAYIQVEIINALDDCQNVFRAAMNLSKMESSEENQDDLKMDGFDSYSDTSSLLIQLEQFLSRNAVSNVFVLSKRKLEILEEYMELSGDGKLPILERTCYIHNLVINQIEKQGFNLMKSRIPFSLLFEVLHVHDSDNTDKLSRVKQFVQAFIRGVEINQYDISCIKKYCHKADNFGYIELNHIMKRSKIIKAINIAGCSYDLPAFEGKLRIAHYNEEDILVLRDYFNYMKHDYAKTKRLRNSSSLRYLPEYPTCYIRKYIGNERYALSNRLMKQAKSEKVFRSLLRKNQFTEEFIQILSQVYRNKKEKTSQTLLSNKKNQSNRFEMSRCDVQSDELIESRNAAKAKAAGMFKEDQLTEEKLKQAGFPYEREFFVWLRVKHYIIAKEIHHTKDENNEWRNTFFYNDMSLSYIVENMDLELLFQLYTNQISYEDALKLKNITFCKVMATSELVGLKTGEPVIVNCIKQNETFWFSKDKYLKRKGNNITVIEEITSYSSTDNARFKKILCKLLGRKKMAVKRMLL